MSNKLRKMLSLHEGRINHAYQDSLGYWTVGVGHLIDKRRGGEIPEHIIDALLEWDIEQAKLHLPEWAEKLDEVRYGVLVDMAFNLGPEPFDGDGVGDWPMFCRQVRDGLYQDAAKNMRSTLWAKQVKGRAERLAKMMETGQWPKDVV